MSTPYLSPWYILSARLLERDRIYYAGPGSDLHLVGHDDWLLIATTPDDPRPWVMSTELWAEHYDSAHNWSTIYRAIAGLSAEAWAGLGWYRYPNAGWPALTPSVLRELAARRTAAEGDAGLDLPDGEAMQRG